MQLELNNNKALLLKTAGKFCSEDIIIKPPASAGSVFIKHNGCVPIIGTQDIDSEPNEVEVEKVYFNINASVEDVKSIFDSLTFQSVQGLNVLYCICGLNVEYNTLITAMVLKENGEYYIVKMTSDVDILFSSSADLVTLLGTATGFEGWNKDFVESGGFIEINGVLAKPGYNDSGLVVDNQQEKYAGIISLTPDFEEVTKELSGEYDGASVAVTQNGKVDISSMLEMKRLPLALEVSVPVPDGYVKPEKEVYTSVNGTLDVTDAAVCTVDVKMINTQPCTFLQLQIPTDNFTLKFKESGFKSWGDGTVDDLITHTYEKAGRYTLVANLAEISHSNTFYQDFENQNVCVTEITVGSAVSEVGIGAFQKCPGLTKVYLHDGITRIGRWAFQLTSLEEVFIPSGVTVIEEYVFADCLNLKRVHIPASVTEIISYAFVRSESIEGFYYGGTVEQWNAITKGQWDSQIGSYTVYCTDGEIVKQ